MAEMTLGVLIFGMLATATVASTNGANCESELCCYVQQMSRHCMSKSSAQKFMDLERSVSAVSETVTEDRYGKRKQQESCCKDVDVLKFEIEQLKDLLTWYKASNGKFYKVFKEWANFTTAMARCAQEGARLAVDGIRNTDTRSEIENLIKAGDDSTWIGLNDVNDEGLWRWNDDVVVDMKQVRWLKYQPDDHKGQEDCGHYWKMVGWFVNDAPCEHLMNFICEKN